MGVPIKNSKEGGGGNSGRSGPELRQRLDIVEASKALVGNLNGEKCGAALAAMRQPRQGSLGCANASLQAGCGRARADAVDHTLDGGGAAMAWPTGTASAAKTSSGAGAGRGLAAGLCR